MGGGVIGASTAYHLATTTSRSVLLLERSGMTHGATWHAAGLVRQLKATQSLTKLAAYSARLFEELEDAFLQAEATLAAVRACQVCLV